jgi:hypothetical protein
VTTLPGVRRASATRAAAALAVALTLALAGCGSSGPSAATYVKSVCTALTGWRDSVQTAGSTLQAAATSSSHVSLTQGKRSYLAFVAALLRATTGTAASLKAAGVPAVDGGSRVSTTLVNAFEGAQKALAGAASQASLIPTTSAAAYAAAASNVTGSIRTALSSMTAISPRSNKQLRAAADRQPACSALKAAG